MAIKKISINAFEIIEKRWHISENLPEIHTTTYNSLKESFSPYWDINISIHDIRFVLGGEVIINLRNDSNLWKLSQTEPLVLTPFARALFSHYPKIWWNSMTNNGIQLLLYQNCFYEITGNYNQKELKLLVLETADKERQKFERLKAKFNSEESRDIKQNRDRIPEQVRVAVWRRDQGKCVNCGSRENLEYDHIIPISEGGSNTVRNIELLCQTCNRSKSNKIQ